MTIRERAEQVWSTLSGMTFFEGSKNGIDLIERAMERAVASATYKADAERDAWQRRYRERCGQDLGDVGAAVSEAGGAHARIEALRKALVEMRRTAVNFADQHVYRCQLDGDCNHFATWERTGRDIAMFVCDNCIERARAYDDRAESKGCGKRPPYKEREDAAPIRELTKASQAAGLLIDEPCPKCKHIGEHGDECQWL